MYLNIFHLMPDTMLFALSFCFEGASNYEHYSEKKEKHESNDIYMNGMMLPGKKSRTPKQATIHIHTRSSFRFKALHSRCESAFFMSIVRVESTQPSSASKNSIPCHYYRIDFRIIFCVMYLNGYRFAPFSIHHLLKMMHTPYKTP